MKPIQAVIDEHRIFVTEKLAENGYQRLLDGPDFVAQAATLERKGGPCPVCGVEFAKVVVDNKFGKFDYYQPACRCFPVCKTVQLTNGTVVGCGRFLITEKLAGIGYCTSCYAQPPGTKAKAARTGTGYRTARKVSRKDAAAGEVEA